MADKKLEIVISAKDQASKELGKISSSFQGFKSTITSVWKSFATLSAVGVTAIAWLGSYALKSAWDFEQTATAFRTMLWDGKKAWALLKELSDFANSTPFEFPEIANAGKSLLAFGFEANKITWTLTTLWDIAASLNIPLGELSEIYGKIKTSGRVFSEDINQLTGRGIPIIAELAKQFGVAESEVRKLVETGKIWFPEVQKAFEAMAWEGGKFSWGMVNQSKTLTGLLSTAKDWLENILKEIVGINQSWEIERGSILDSAKWMLSDLIKYLSENTEEIKSFWKIVISAIWGIFDAAMLFKDITVWVVTGIHDAIISVWNFFDFLSWKTEDASQKLDIGKWSIYDYKTAIEKLAWTAYKANTEWYQKERAEIVKNINATISLLKARQAVWIQAIKDQEKWIATTGAGTTAPLKTGLPTWFKLDLSSISSSAKDATKEMEKFMSNSNDLWKTKELKDAEESLVNIDKTIEKIRKDEIKWWWISQSVTWWSGWKKAIDDQKKSFEDLKNLWKETSMALQWVFWWLATWVDTHKSKLLGLKDDYQKLKDKLKEVGDTGVKELQKIQDKLDEQASKMRNITGEWQMDVAKRLIEAQKELQAIKDKQALGEWITNDELQKRFALEKEIALWESKTTWEERAKAIEESQKSEIQLILDKTAKKLLDAEAERLEIQKTYDAKKIAIDKEKADITAQMEQRKTEMMSEFSLYQSLISQKKAIETEYFALFQKNIKQQMDKTMEAISLVNQLKEKSGWKTVWLDGARALGWPVSANRSYLVGENWPEIFTPWASGKINNNPQASSPTININLGWVTVNGEADENRLVEKIKQALIRETQLYANWITA